MHVEKVIVNAVLLKIFCKEDTGVDATIMRHVQRVLVQDDDSDAQEFILFFSFGNMTWQWTAALRKPGASTQNLNRSIFLVSVLPKEQELIPEY